MNHIFKYSTRPFFVAFLQISIALAVSSCDRDSTTEDDECTEIGETESCETEFGNTGFMVCLPEGIYTECMYHIPKAGQPCSVLGEELKCACDGRLNGNIYCLEDHIYSECLCKSSSTSPTVSAGSGGQDTVPESSGACPAPYSCVELAQSGTANKLCVEGAMPPGCETNADCDAEGLEEAQCLDIGLGAGTKICLLVCD